MSLLTSHVPSPNVPAGGAGWAVTVVATVAVAVVVTCSVIVAPADPATVTVAELAGFADPPAPAVPRMRPRSRAPMPIAGLDVIHEPFFLGGGGAGWNCGGNGACGGCCGKPPWGGCGRKGWFGGGGVLTKLFLSRGGSSSDKPHRGPGGP